MRVLSHPLRLDAAGSFVTIEQSSSRQAAELAGSVLATSIAERGLAPLYGSPDTVGSFPSADAYAGAVTFCEPDIVVTQLDIDTNAAGDVSVRASVDWA